METRTTTYEDEETAEVQEIIVQKKDDRFKQLYFFVIFVYASQMTEETGRMVSSISGNPFPFLLPIVLTLLLLYRHPVSFRSKGFWTVMGATALWSIASLIKYKDFSTQELSYYFFLFYAIIVAYIHVNVYGKKLTTYYEKTMVLMCKLSIPLWIFCVLAPSYSDTLFSFLPETHFGHNLLYIFNKINAQVYIDYALLRNAGCSWEPGRFAIMICFGILFNLYKNGVKFKDNSNLIWLLLAMATTESTTGYGITIVLIGLFLVKKASQGLILYSIAFLMLSWGTLGLSFMSGKILQQFESIESMSILVENSDKSIEQTGATFALDRMPSLIFEYVNFIKEPLLGYSRNFLHSDFYINTSQNLFLTGGLMQMFSQYGLFMGLFFYFMLFRSSASIVTTQDYGNKWALFICSLLSLISYPLFVIPIFTAFWLFGPFWEGKDNEYELIWEEENIDLESNEQLISTIRNQIK